MQQVLSEGDLDRVFGALADPTRRAILRRLSEGSAGVLEVAAPFAMTQPAITKHLNVLEAAGFITRRRVSRRHVSRLDPERLQSVATWMGSYQATLVERFVGLDAYLEELQGK